MNLALLGLLAPLFGFLFLMFTAGKMERKLTGLIASTTVLTSFVCFIALLLADIRGSFTFFNWISIHGFSADFTLHVDPLSLLMALVITGVGYLIHLYSSGYTDHDEDYGRYFACLNFFIFAMLLLVLAGNLLLLFVGWEGVGLASYLLIGFWYHRPAAAKAATKAFIVNRIGDLGLILGILLTYKLFGTSDIALITERAGKEFVAGSSMITLLTTLYFIGAAGKSAQIPLHVWLPDAMEGPTPVSALIHAATMVTAGVYLVVRLNPLFTLAPATMNLIAVIGTLTALFAATAASAQTELKKVLAYSTVSQLGLMFLACGVGAYYAAMFHLTMHAFVKALLFLTAGNVIHMMHGATGMEKMGGLAQKMPKSRFFFLIGTLAMAGIPPLAAFFSKDLLLDETLHAGYLKLYVTGILVSVLTAYYLMRAYILTFTGKPRLEEKIFKVIKEAPLIMTVPVSFLLILSVIGGFLGYTGKTPAPLERFLAPFFHTHMEGFEFTPMAAISIVAAFFGLGLAWFIYTEKKKQMGQPFAPGPVTPLRALLKKAYFVDTIYHTLLVVPLSALSRLIAQILERRFFEAMIHWVAAAAQAAAGGLQRIQSGQIRSYVAWLTLGMVFIFFIFVF